MKNKELYNKKIEKELLLYQLKELHYLQEVQKNKNFMIKDI